MFTERDVMELEELKDTLDNLVYKKLGASDIPKADKAIVRASINQTIMIINTILIHDLQEKQLNLKLQMKEMKES